MNWSIFAWLARGLALEYEATGLKPIRHATYTRNVTIRIDGIIHSNRRTMNLATRCLPAESSGNETGAPQRRDAPVSPCYVRSADTSADVDQPAGVVTTASPSSISVGHRRSGRWSGSTGRCSCGLRRDPVEPRRVGAAVIGLVQSGVANCSAPMTTWPSPSRSSKFSQSYERLEVGEVVLRARHLVGAVGADVRELQRRQHHVILGHLRDRALDERDALGLVERCVRLMKRVGGLLVAPAASGSDRRSCSPRTGCSRKRSCSSGTPGRVRRC